MKPVDPFSEKCIYVHKIKYIDVESITVYSYMYYKGTQLCSNTFLKSMQCYDLCAYLLIH